MASVNIKDLFSVNADLNTKSVNALLKAIKEGATDGFDYLRFKTSVKNIADMDMGDMQSYKTVFSTAQTIGVTKDKLIKSANYYKTILRKELEKFGTALQKQYKQRVTDKQEQAKSFEKKIKDTKNKIATLQKELDAYEANINTLNKIAEKENVKITATREQFLTAHNELKNSIEQDIKMMQDYL